MESTMSTINKELYDALIEAKVGEETASNAAKSVQGEEQNKRLDNIDKRLIVVETKLDTVSTQGDRQNERLDNIEKRITIVETKLDTTNRLLWIVIAGVAGILIKTLLV